MIVVHRSISSRLLPPGMWSPKKLPYTCSTLEANASRADPCRFVSYATAPMGREEQEHESCRRGDLLE